MSEWRIMTLGEICDEVDGLIQTGPFGSQLHESDYSEDGTPVIMPKDLVEGKITTDKIARVSYDHVERLSRHKLVKGDIVYGRRGDIGRQALIREEENGWLCGTGCLRISLGDSIIDPLFLHYYLQQKSVIKWIANQAVGATLPNLNTRILRDVSVCMPDFQEQKRIAGILSAYDDLIENCQRRIKILETMARSIYREWFVKFRFPGHENVPLVPSPLGNIPQGWEVKRLGEVLELSYGKALKKENRCEGVVPVYGSSGIVGYHDTCLVEGPGIIVGRKGNVGSVFWSDDDFFVIDTAYFITSALPLRFFYYLLPTLNFINSDAAVPGLSRNQAYTLEILIPSTVLLYKFCEFVDTFEHQVSTLQSQIQNLRSTRNLLLPHLLSGQTEI
ncbi:MAG: restriction endonuclease subunit S [Chlorobiaceae bacterium]|nr:restriction endonuclease subunit S [Chlorobiaceae bacterium]